LGDLNEDHKKDLNNNPNSLNELDPSSFNKFNLKRHSITNANLYANSLTNAAYSKNNLNSLSGSNIKLNDLNESLHNLNKLNNNFKSSNDLLDNKKSNSNNNSMIFLHPDNKKSIEAFHSSENLIALSKNNNINQTNNLIEYYDNKNKRKSQSDLLKINDLNNSLNNLSRSSSISYANELDLKVNLANNSQLNGLHLLL
jgi:hypothetical protein